MNPNKETLESEIKRLQSRFEEITAEREHITKEIERLQNALLKASSLTTSATLTPAEKIKLFRSLFKGRDDVYPKLWVSKKTGAKGYTPVCENEWKSGICRKPTVKCGECDNRQLNPVTDETIRSHLDGHITAGVYPLLQNETCYFLAVDFDKESWQEDVKAFMTICQKNNIPAYLERSRSGNGGHIWIFFSDPVPAALARQMGIFLITETMDQGQQLDMKSYDRLFPNQDTMPKGGFGNLIALPLQKVPRENGNSVFIDDQFKPHADQWAYLANAKKISSEEVQLFVGSTMKTRDLMGIRSSQTDDEGPPWESQLNSRRIISKLPCVIPSEVNAVQTNRLYIDRDGLPPQLLVRIKKLASFQNPEFFKKQSMRFSTAQTPRVICCAEDLNSYLAIPRGCIDDLKAILSENGSALLVDDKRNSGEHCIFNFQGNLTDTQEGMIKELLKHSIGVFVAPPGVGKTVLGIKLIAERKTNTLVLVHRKPLLDQWKTQISAFLGIPIKEIGHIGGGKDKATNIIDVAMIQSLEKQRNVDERIKGYGHIIVDECHHISAVSFERVLSEANPKYITGLTATPYRRDGHQPIIIMQCGPVRYKISSKAQTSEATFSQKLISKHTNFSYQWAENDPVTVIWPALVTDEDRNRMICDDVIQNLRENRSPIILTERKEHLELLKELLQDSVKHLVVLHGGMRAPQRREMLSKLANVPADEERLILATGPYIGEGFDDPRLDTLFLVMPFSFKGKMVQYAGRLHRKYDGKTEVRIYDYVDHMVPVLQKMYKKRLRAYKTLGYTKNT